ncbi:MAG: DUF1929 domain-containing protein [Planctomycetes bacterium]|nr:DUF1929 domain-containing protein [Planctomycetota bacterium]
MSFDHEHSGANATPYLFPGASLAGTGADYQPGGFFGWGDWLEPTQPQIAGKFNAIHMSLIPKGPYRGHVLVWNRYPVYVDVGSTYSSGTGGSRYWACQAWSIVNPDDNAPAPRFRNFLLPMTPAGNVAPTLGMMLQAGALFCSGHAWSPAGELVVAGGDEFTWVPPNTLTQAVGAKWLFLWDPSQASAPFPFGGATAPLYPGEVGAWLVAPFPNDRLAVTRYYPTVMMTHRLSRLGNVVETMLVAGGSDPANPGILPGGPSPMNTYESYIVRANGSAAPFLQQDLVAGATVPVYRGPGSSSAWELDWFIEYPRINLLTDGSIFLSGWAPQGARWNPEYPYPASAPFPPTGLSAFDYTVGSATTSVWNDTRRYGSSVFLARYGAFNDVVVRLCGGTYGPAMTASSEFCLASVLNAPWNDLGDVSGTYLEREHSNAVVLPDASILVLGGNEAGLSGEEVVARYTPATGWQGIDKLPTWRRYHGTSLLLPDGRVLVGGGDLRYDTSSGLAPHDYDIYEPAYKRAAQPLNPLLVGVPQDAEGTYLLSPNQAGIRLEVGLSGMGSLDRVVLTAPGSVTHHADMSARYVELASVAVDPKARLFNLPAETVAPRGYYLLWGVDNSGIPTSTAAWVRIQ